MSDYEKYLFRGKEKNSGEWIYGDLRHISDGHGGYILCIVDNTNGRNNDVTGVEVIPETVGMFIMLTDKNRTKIFEGDIVKNSRFNKIEEVRYIDKRKRVMFCGINYIVDLEYINEIYYEVIGNIYENTELLGEPMPMKPASKNVAQSGLAPATENFELMGG